MRNFPRGPFSTILADPAWQFKTRSEKGRGRCPDGVPKTRAAQRRNQPERHYATMTLDEIKALPVANVAAKDCGLFLWAIDPMLPQALEVGAAWGFEFKTVGFYWAKLRKSPMKPGRNTHLNDERKAFPMGTGYWTRANPEMCLLFTRGRPERLSAGVAKLIAMDHLGCPSCEQGVPLHEMTEPACIYCDSRLREGGFTTPSYMMASLPPRLIVSPRREHSRKPDEQYERIEALVGGPYLELFARTERPGWTTWGDQVGQFQSAAPASQDRRTDVSALLGLSEGLKPAGTHPQGRPVDIKRLIG